MLKWVISSIILMLATTAAARASVEFCPATASVLIPVGGAFGTASQRYSYELTAPTPRIVSAKLIADTDNGWYTWAVTSVALKNVTREFQIKPISPDYLPERYTIAASPTLSVFFPNQTIVRHAWIVSAEAQGDPSLVWASKGVSSCDVPPYVTPADIVPPNNDVSGPPSPLIPPATAVSAEVPFKIAGCAREFSASRVLDPVQPAFTRTYGGPVSMYGYTATVEVDLDPAGNLIDASIYASSGNAAFNKAVLRAAQSSTYSGSVSYCRHVNGNFLFRATYLPS